MASGVDLYSAYQRVASWAMVRDAGYQFAYLKVGDGTSTRTVGGLDPAGARRAGVATGAYWYAQPGDPVCQADMLCDRAAALGLLDLAPCLDIEAPFRPNATAVRFAIRFVRRVRARGHRPCLYANNSMMRVLRAAVVAAEPSTLIWVARYGAAPSLAFDLWQFSQSGQVPGIAAVSVDLNRGLVPRNVPAPNGPAHQPGGLESMGFADTFRDWAGNTQSVRGWMDNQDRGRWEIRNDVLGMFNQQLKNPVYDPHNTDRADIRSHRSYAAWDWITGANVKGEWANRKLDALAKQVSAQRAQLDALTEAVTAIRSAIVPASPAPAGNGEAEIVPQVGEAP